MFSTISLVLLWCVSVVVASPLTQESQATIPPSVSIAVISFDGTTCPSSNRENAPTVELNESGQSQSFTISYQTFAATKTPSTQDCNVTLRLSYSKGWQFEFNAAELRGTSNLASGTSGNARITSWLVGSSVKNTVNKAFGGGNNADYRAALNLLKQVWSSCGTTDSTIVVQATLNIGASSSPGDSTLTLDSTTMEFQWKKCP